jgi:hypothetical protein
MPVHKTSCVCDVYHQQCFSCRDTWVMNMAAQAERYRSTTMEHTCQLLAVPKTGSNIWSGNMEDDEERRTSSAYF